jgi:alpha-L-arabinofuranosidase
MQPLPRISSLLALLAALSLVPASAQTGNLTHRYSFNGNANDLIGTANGVLQGGASLSSGALVLDGVSGYLSLPANIVTGYTAITLEAWVTDNGSAAWARIFDFGNNTTDYMFLSVPAGGGNLRGAYTTNGNGAEQVLQWPGSGRPPVGQESHIVWTSDSTTHTGLLYVNGVPVGTNANMTLTPAALGPTVNNWLGRSQFGADPYFNGAFDEFRIWNVALSSNSVAQNYLLGPDQIAGGPVYIITQPQGQTVVQARTASFATSVGGTPPFSLQWYRNNSPMSGQTNQTLSFTASLADDNASYQLWATNSYTNTVFVASSSNAVLHVTPDTTPPTLVAALSIATNKLQVVFSEPLNPASVVNLSNYLINGPGGPTGGTAASLDSSGTTVTLTIPPLVLGASYTLTVNGVSDIAGNVIATNSQTSFTYIPNSISIQADTLGLAQSSNLFGIFFEEISFAGEGGLYAEMVRNRALGNSTNADYWALVTQGTAVGSMVADSAVPLNTNIPRSLKVTMTSGTGSVGAGNSGFWGLSLTPGAIYDLTGYAKAASGFGGPVNARLESADGTRQYAQISFSGLSSSWQRFAVSLTSSGSDTNARLVMSITQPTTIWLDVVSLFPRATFTSRTNGMRADLANMLLAMKPSFMRFPGGNYIEGNVLSDAVRWKTTIGDIAQRPGHRNSAWGYWSTDGLGYHEFLQLCEDLGAEPLFGINCGLSLGYNGSTNNTVPLAQMGPWVQDAVDAVQYANGDTNTYWGALRAANGHPAPFNLKYLEIGNENGGSYYNDRYALFYDALKSNYPNLHLIANVWGGIPSSRPVEIQDEHYYSTPGTFISYAHKYDGYSRTGPKVFVGEYAVTSGYGTLGNLQAALGEAAFMTGMERNSDIVMMASYAPLFQNVNYNNWRPDAIYYDNQRRTGTPSYYVQQMFGVNRGDFQLPTTVTATTTPSTNHGAIGVATWNTQSAYSNLVVVAGTNTLYQSDFSTPAGTNGWTFGSGTWVVTGGALEQTAGGTDNRATYGSNTWNNYTYTLKAMKLGGSEGFLIMFNVLDSNNYMWWNIGGWNNTQTGIEWAQNGTKSLMTAVPMTIASNQWYDIRIEVGARIRCYLNGALIHDIVSGNEALYTSTSYLQSRGHVIFKAVNVNGTDIATEVRLNAARGIAPSATAIVLTSSTPLDENSLAQPNHVQPFTNTVGGVSPDFAYTFPAYSLTILRFQERPDWPVGISLNTGTNQLSASALLNGVAATLSSFITNAVTVNYTLDAPDGIIATGMLAFGPGDLSKSIPIPPAVFAGRSIVRVILSNPSNGQLSGVTRTYYVNLPIGGGPLLGLAQFPDENVVYWADPAYALQSTGSLGQPWTTLTNMPSPVRITLAQGQQFYRLQHL